MADVTDDGIKWSDVPFRLANSIPLQLNLAPDTPAWKVTYYVALVSFFAVMVAIAIAVVHILAHTVLLRSLALFVASIFGYSASARADEIARRGGADTTDADGDIVKDLKEHPRSNSEQHVIEIFEKLTGKPFPTVLPKWLVHNGKRLELDGYCKDLTVGERKVPIAVEFSGPLHTKWYPNRESRTKFAQRVQRDEAKIRICRKQGVRLFVIDMRIPRHNMYAYVKSRLYDVGFCDRPSNYLAEEIYKPDMDYAGTARGARKTQDSTDI